MELRDCGHILRSVADSWVEQGKLEDTDTDIGRGYASAQRNHGKTQNDILDKCEIPQLEDEIE